MSATCVCSEDENTSLIQKQGSDVTEPLSDSDSESCMDEENPYVLDQNYCNEKEKKTVKTTSTSTIKSKVVQTVKYINSVLLLGFCVALIIAAIFAHETPVAQSMHPLVAFIFMWLLIFWLEVLEGGQGSLVGLKPIQRESYARTHPMAYKCTGLAHRGDHLNRFIVGRQFLVVLGVFCLNLCCTPVENDSNPEEENGQGSRIPGFSKALDGMFLESGIAVMIITVILGQLAAEVNATNCMLDFINTPVMYIATWVCLAIEASGLLHCVYLVQKFFGLFAKDTREGEAELQQEKQTYQERIAFWARAFVSLAITTYAMTVTLSALLHDQTTMYEGLPTSASVVIFFGLVFFLGMLEALQIALFAVVNLPEEALAEYPVAQDNCRLSFRGSNFQAFLIGRQIFVTMCMFLLARITTTNVDAATTGDTVLNMSPALQGFFNTGLPGALITTIVASLSFRIIASSFPVPFMANPLVNIIIRLCLLVEATGVFSAAWLLADILKKAVGFQLDEVYLGALGQRAALDEDLERTGTASFSDDDDDVEFQSLSPTSYGATNY